MTRQLPALTASVADTTHFLQRKEQTLSDRARLLALFDSAAECNCDVTLREVDEPEAGTQLVLWASARGKTFDRSAGEGWRTLQVVISATQYRVITVYLHAEAA